MLLFNKTIRKKMYISVSQDHQLGHHHKNVPVSQDQNTENIPVSKDHHITTKMYLFHKTIAINSTCFTKPSAKYISVSQDHCYKTYLFYRRPSAKKWTRFKRPSLQKFTWFRQDHHKENVHISKDHHQGHYQKIYLFHKTMTKKMYLFHKTMTKENVPISKDHHSQKCCCLTRPS